MIKKVSSGKSHANEKRIHKASDGCSCSCLCVCGQQAKADNTSDKSSNTQTAYEA